MYKICIKFGQGSLIISDLLRPWEYPESNRKVEQAAENKAWKGTLTHG